MGTNVVLVELTKIYRDAADIMSDGIQFKGRGLDWNDIETVEHLSNSLRRLYFAEFVIDVRTIGRR
jgi:hypothetical protein